MSKSIHMLCAIDHAALDQAVAHRKILLFGDTVYASLDRETPVGYVVQPARATVPIWRLSKHAPQLYMSVAEQLLSEPFKRARFAFALDGYLQWAISQKSRREGALILLGGAVSRDFTHMMILVVHEGRLVEVSEKRLPTPDIPHFRESVKMVLADLEQRYPLIDRIVSANPLPNLGVENIVHIADRPFRRLTYRPLKTYGKEGRQLGWLPGGIIAAGVVYYLAALGMGWNQYTDAQQDYQVAMADPKIRQAGGIDPDLLSIMQKRHDFMEEPRRQELLSEKAAAIVQGFGRVTGVQVTQMEMPAPSAMVSQVSGLIATNGINTDKQQTERPSDVLLSFAVTKNSQTAIEQGRALLAEIGQQTGMSLRITPTGVRETDDRRIFTVEGFLHDQP
jgi:hypothetical protein